MQLVVFSLLAIGATVLAVRSDRLMLASILVSLLTILDVLATVAFGSTAFDSMVMFRLSRSRWNGALACLAFFTLSSSVLADPLSDLMPVKAGVSACFARDYEEVHLKKHPAQKTQSVLLSLKYEDEHPFPSVRIMLRQKGHEQPFYVVGGCAWNEHANRDIKDRRMLPAFKKEAGLDCSAITGLSSAEEGGDFPIDLPGDGRTLGLYLFDGIAAWSGTDQTHDASQMGLGKDDLIFHFERTDPNACKTMEQELQTQ
jgi:hypothetical protein